MRNPRAKAHLVLGVTDTTWANIKAAVLATLDAKDNQEEVDEAVVRAAHPALANDRLWNEVKKVIGA